MSRYNNRRTFDQNGTFVVLKAFTFNGVAFQTGSPFPGDAEGVVAGPRQLRLLWEQKRIDMADPDAPPVVAPVAPVETGPAQEPAMANSGNPAGPAPAQQEPEGEKPDVATPAFEKRAMGFGRFQIFDAAGNAVSKQVRGEAAADQELARLIAGGTPMED